MPMSRWGQIRWSRRMSSYAAGHGSARSAASGPVPYSGTYLGDSTIGATVNVGAGTITCNYDGHKKHRTDIEDNVFVGSNSTLVAPVRIGEGAFIAAGSVITNNVESDSLAIGRARQTDKIGWAAKRREIAKREE